MRLKVTRLICCLIERQDEKVQCIGSFPKTKSAFYMLAVYQVSLNAIGVMYVI